MNFKIMGFYLFLLFGYIIADPTCQDDIQCNDDRCCSEYGYCGTGIDYCDYGSPSPDPSPEVIVILVILVIIITIICLGYFYWDFVKNLFPRQPPN